MLPKIISLIVERCCWFAMCKLLQIECKFLNKKAHSLGIGLGSTYNHNHNYSPKIDAIRRYF